MSFKDFSTAQKPSNKDTVTGKPKSTLDELESTKQSDKGTSKDAPATKD